jgi:hypothetical protein
MLVVGKEADKFIRNNLYEFVCNGVMKIQDGKIKMSNNHISKRDMNNTIKTFLTQIQDANEHTISGIEYLDMDNTEYDYFALKDSNSGEYLFNIDRLIFLLKGLDCLYDDIVIKKNDVPILVFKQEDREIAYLVGEEYDEKKKKKIKQKTDISEKVRYRMHTIVDFHGNIWKPVNSKEKKEWHYIDSFVFIGYKYDVYLTKDGYVVVDKEYLYSVIPSVISKSDSIMKKARSIAYKDYYEEIKEAQDD